MSTRLPSHLTGLLLASGLFVAACSGEPPRPTPDAETQARMSAIASATAHSTATARSTSAPAATSTLAPIPAVLQPGRYQCSSRGAAPVNGKQPVGMPAPMVVTIDAGGAYQVSYSQSDGRYAYDAATGEIAWRGGFLEGIAATYQSHPRGWAIVLRSNRWEPCIYRGPASGG